MKTLHIPELACDVSRLGLGSMVFSVDRKEQTFALLDRFFAAGGNLIDSAEVYGTEPALALWLEARGNREQAIVLTKSCTDPESFAPEAMREKIRGNLARLRTDYIDLWVMHRDNPAVPVKTIVDTLNEEVRQGRVRAFGGSNWSTARIREANEYAAANGLMGMAVSSPHVCLAIAKEPFWAGCTQAYAEDLAWHAQSGVPLVAWSSQGRGFFLDASGPQDTNENLIRVYHNEANFARLERARELAKQKGVAPVQIALAYVLNLAAPTIALVGPATTAEVDSCVVGEQIALTAEEVRWLEEG